MTAILGQNNLRRIVLRERDVPGGAGGIEEVISAASTLDATVGRILRDTGLPVPGIVAPGSAAWLKAAAAPAPLPLHA
jgi:hypothetical protein